MRVDVQRRRVKGLANGPRQFLHAVGLAARPRARSECRLEHPLVLTAVPRQSGGPQFRRHERARRFGGEQEPHRARRVRGIRQRELPVVLGGEIVERRMPRPIAGADLAGCVELEERGVGGHGCHGCDRFVDRGLGRTRWQPLGAGGRLASRGRHCGGPGQDRAAQPQVVTAGDPHPVREQERRPLPGVAPDPTRRVLGLEPCDEGGEVLPIDLVALRAVEVADRHAPSARRRDRDPHVTILARPTDTRGAALGPGMSAASATMSP